MQNKLKPQEGKQTQFLSSTADIVLYGGGAGGGKTYGLLLEASRNIETRGYGAVIFRKSLTQITKEGALWDTASNIYPQVGGRPVQGNRIQFTWKQYGSKIDFSYLARNADVNDWQGTQIPLICFDELTHFTKHQFLYMLSRNRSTCGVKPYIRATTNPDPDSWVREFVDWWIGKDGYMIEERSGLIRYFVNQNDEIHWFNRRIDAVKAFPHTKPKSFTFISSSVYDNKIQMEKDPGYLSNLQALPRVERERLLFGNWNVRVGAGDYFKRRDFEVVDAVPNLKKAVRAWDLAGTTPSETNPDPDWTVGVKLGLDNEGVFYVMDVRRERLNPAEVKALIKNTATQDGRGVYIHIPQDAGSAGKVVAHNYVSMLAGYKVKAKPVTGSKEVRATPASGQSGVGNIKVLRAPWNEAFFNELESFPLGKHDDQVDALSDAVEELTNRRQPVRVIRKPKMVR